MLGHQLPVLPPVEHFWESLPEIFSWITTGAQMPQRQMIYPTASETAVQGRVLPMSIPNRSRAPLEIIRFAAANHLCVDLAYDGSLRRIEPYSLRQTAEGNFVLHAVRVDSGQHRSYRVDNIQSASVTSDSFSPRYAIELTQSGPLPVAPSTANPQQTRKPSRKTTRLKGIDPVFVYRCGSCGKTFERKSMDGKLNPHKNRNGYQCYGSIGTFVKTRY